MAKLFDKRFSPIIFFFKTNSLVSRRPLTMANLGIGIPGCQKAQEISDQRDESIRLSNQE
jgi:hypothetical protein